MADESLINRLALWYLGHRKKDEPCPIADEDIFDIAETYHCSPMDVRSWPKEDREIALVRIKAKAKVKQQLEWQDRFNESALEGDEHGRRESTPRH